MVKYIFHLKLPSQVIKVIRGQRLALQRLFFTRQFVIYLSRKYMDMSLNSKRCKSCQWKEILPLVSVSAFLTQTVLLDFYVNTANITT